MYELTFLYDNPLVKVKGKKCSADNLRALFTEVRRVITKSIPKVPIVTTDDKYRARMDPDAPRGSWTDGQTMTELTKLFNDDAKKRAKEAGTLAKWKEVERPASYEAFFAMAESFGFAKIVQK